MSLLQARAAHNDLPAGQSNWVVAWDAILIDDAGWYNDAAGHDQIELPTGRYRVDISAICTEDLSSVANEVRIALWNNSTTKSRWRHRRAAGVLRPELCVSGLFIPSIAAPATYDVPWVELYFANGSTARDWSFEIVIETAE